MSLQSKHQHRKKPDWLKIKLDINEKYNDTKRLVESQKLNTVCEEAKCPNIYECWGNKTATMMILGDICTRSCGFCSVKTGKPDKADNDEPKRIAFAIKSMKLRHAVITSVDRDDLKNDYGAEIWTKTINEIRNTSPQCTIEVLTPDFKNYLPSLFKIFNAYPDIFSHNVECVPRISKFIRPQSDWDRSKNVLKESVGFGLLTKTGMMVGLGETDSEVLEVMEEMSDLGVEIFTIGQYLQPTKRHQPVDRYVHPEIFKKYKEWGSKMNFKVIESGPLVRSSYHADQQARMVI